MKTSVCVKAAAFVSLARTPPLVRPYIAPLSRAHAQSGASPRTVSPHSHHRLSIMSEFSSGIPVEYSACPKCRGEGRIGRQASRKARLRHKRARLDTPPPTRWESCATCEGTGLVSKNQAETPQESCSFHVAIIGGGIGGLALALACRHRSISCTVYERDSQFDQRSQGYGLTMQQASKALKAFGIDLKGGVTSTKHVVHTPDGAVVGEWGMRKWGKSQKDKSPKRQNVHIARQGLRYQLLEALGGPEAVEWNCQLLQFMETKDHVELKFSREGQQDPIQAKAQVVVGADGIRSTVREVLVGGNVTPLRYLDCIVILGICPTVDIASSSPLLDGETVFQTADGTTRLYTMPYSSHEYMWQLSFPMTEDGAKALSSAGPSALKQEALVKCQSWHDPIPSLLMATPASLVSGYPVYDRALLSLEMLQNPRVTLLGDAAFPMSPFKGQGANQALLDALSLSRTLCKSSDTDLAGALRDYENEMLSRSAVKVKASAEAARFLHTNVAIQKGNVTRGGVAKKADVANGDLGGNTIV